MIGFMLQGARQQPGRFDLDLVAFQSLRARHDRFCALDFTGDFRKTQATFRAHFGFVAQFDLGIDQDERHRCLGIDILAVQLHRALSIFHTRNVQDSELERFAHLLRGQPHAVRRLHRLQHVSGQLANAIVDLVDPFAFRAQHRVAVLQDRQFHFS